MRFSRCKERWSAFSLLELLVVAALIGTLLALLLPAVQAAREASRRSSCQNNLKQVGIALGVHENSFRALPVGAQENGGFGISWWVSVARFLEQSAAIDRFDMTGANNGFALVHQKNGELVDDLIVGSMICPSSPLESLLPVGRFQVMMPSYVGISGAANGEGFTENRVSACCAPANDGELSAGGVLIPNSAIRIREITDGASHTIAVGEASDFVFTDGGVHQRIDGGYRPGWIMGTSVVGTPPNYFAPYAAWNLATIRYPPNTRRYDLPGIKNDHGPNNPLVSPHPGGVSALHVDGSVVFLSTEIDLATFKTLATRDDGRTVN